MKYFDYRQAVIDVLEQEFGHSDLHVNTANKIIKAIKLEDLLAHIRGLKFANDKLNLSDL